MSTLNKRITELERQAPPAGSGVSVIFRRIVAPKGSDSSRSDEITSASIIGHGRQWRSPDENEAQFLKRLEDEFPHLTGGQAFASEVRS